MLKIYSIAMVLMLTACSAQTSLQTKPVDRNADVADLTELKKITWRKLYDEKDADGLEGFLADDFILIAGDNFSSKDKEVGWLRENSWNGPEDFVYAIEDIVFITDDAAIIYGRGTSTRTTEDGKPCMHKYISSNTVRRVGKKWHPVSSHVSDSKCDPIGGE